MGQFFFKQDKLKDPDTIAALRTLALGKPWEKPLLGELLAMLKANDDPQQKNNPSTHTFKALHQRFQKLQDELDVWEIEKKLGEVE
jgi:hypothetical protein